MTEGFSALTFSCYLLSLLALAVFVDFFIFIVLDFEIKSYVQNQGTRELISAQTLWASFCFRFKTVCRCCISEAAAPSKCNFSFYAVGTGTLYLALSWLRCSWKLRSWCASWMPSGRPTATSADSNLSPTASSTPNCLSRHPPPSLQHPPHRPSTTWRRPAPERLRRIGSSQDASRTQ